MSPPGVWLPPTRPPAPTIIPPILPDSPWFYPCPPGYRGSALLIGGPWVLEGGD